MKVKKENGNEREREEIRRMVTVLLIETSPEAIADVSDSPLSLLNSCVPLALISTLAAHGYLLGSVRRGPWWS